MIVTTVVITGAVLAILILHRSTIIARHKLDWSPSDSPSEAEQR